MFRSLTWLPPGWYKQEYDYNNNVQICRIVLTHYNRILFTPARRQPPSGRNTLVVSTWLNSLNTLVCICWLLGAFAKLRKATTSFVMSVRPHGTARHWMDFDEIWYLSFLEKSVDKFQVSLKSDENNGYFTWRLFTFFTVSHWIFLRTRNISNKSYRQNQNTYFTLNKFFFPKIALFVK
jgi:hypothetical protein